MLYQGYRGYSMDAGPERGHGSVLDYCNIEYYVARRLRDVARMDSIFGEPIIIFMP